MSTFSEKRKVLRNGLTRATLKVLRNMRNCFAIFIQDRFLQVSGACLSLYKSKMFSLRTITEYSDVSDAFRFSY